MGSVYVNLWHHAHHLAGSAHAAAVFQYADYGVPDMRNVQPARNRVWRFNARSFVPLVAVVLLTGQSAANGCSGAPGATSGEPADAPVVAAGNTGATTGAVVPSQPNAPSADRPVAAAPDAADGTASATGAATPGQYFCTGYGMNAGGGMGFVPKGSFTLHAGGRYSANSTSGRFTVTEGKLTFSGGAYDGITGTYEPQEGTPRFVLTWPNTQGGRPSTQYCRLVEE